MRKKLDQFTSVFFISKFDEISENLSNTKTKVIPDCIDPKIYTASVGKTEACEFLNLDEKKFNVLFIGGVNSLKGFDTIIRAFNLIHDENINLIVAGYSFYNYKINSFKNLIKVLKSRENYNFQKQIKNYIDNQKLTNIKFIGVQQNIAIAFEACNILVIPMNKAHQSRPAFEIAAQKKTFIISNFNQIKDFCKNGENCLMFKARDENDLADKIISLYIDSNYTKKLGETNYQYMIDKHTKEVSDILLFKAIEEILY
jgi:glycosyltransferase involved in cell wall biosynthesis